jgi:hypothetical protein
MLFSQRAEVAVKVQKDIELLPLITSLKKERLVRRVMAMCTGAPLITEIVVKVIQEDSIDKTDEFLKEATYDSYFRR